MAYQVQQQPRARQQAPQKGRKPYFGLYTEGIGYLHDIRLVKSNGSNGRKAKPFWCCRINALRGNSESPDYTKFDLSIPGADALKWVQNLEETVNAKNPRNKVLVAFRIGDIYTRLYEREVRDQNDRKTGYVEPAALIKGRLLAINYIKVNDEVIYSKPRDDGNDGDDTEAQQQAQGNPQPDPAGTAARQPGAQPRSQPAQRPQPRMPQAPVGNQQQENGIADDGADGQGEQYPEPAYDPDDDYGDGPF